MNLPASVLITGAHGGLGRAWTAALQARGHRVHACTRDGAEGSHACDLSNADAFTALLEQIRPQVVLHLAADFGADLGRALAVNFESSRALLHWAKNRAVQTRIVLIGTAAEYGVVAADAGAISEAHALAPVSAYGMSKACQSQLLSLYASQGVDVVCARLFNLRADQQGSALSARMFVGRVSQQIKEIQAGTRQFIEVGPLAAQRDFIVMTQAIKQLDAILELGAAGQIYHVASGVPITMRELLAQELAAAGLSFECVRSAPELSNRTGLDVPIIYADISKTMRLLRNQTAEVTAHA